MALLLGDFEGSWRVARRIEDARGPGGRFEGRAVFAPDGQGGLVYDEDGTLTLDGQGPVTATRRYLWRPDGAGRVAVLFADGRAFHGFSLAGAAAAEHWCDPDHYLVVYGFADWPEWTADWRVSGPRKAYRLRSRYRRAA